MRAMIAAAALVVLSSWGVPAFAGQALLDGADDAFDDPKLARQIRRLKPVIPPVSVGQPRVGPAAMTTRSGSATVGSPGAAARSGVLPSAPPSTAQAPVPLSVAPRAPMGETAAPDPRLAAPQEFAPKSQPSQPEVGVVAADMGTRRDDGKPASSDGNSGPWPYAPRLKFAYRRFPFTRVGAPSASLPTTLGPGSPQSFESASLDFYPISWFLRVGLSTQFGWESEKFDRSGDYFVAQSGSVGFQLPGRVTPFVEGLAGAGYMSRRQSDTTLPTAYWQVGIDAGVEIYVANRAYASLAVGYLHPANLFLMQQSLMSVQADTWSLKFGVGI